MRKVKESKASAASLSEQEEAISRQLVDARLNACALTEYPGLLPDTLEQAYAIQSASITRWPDAVGGWKVGMVPEADRSRYSAERLVGPIFNSAIHRLEAGAGITMPVYVGGFAAVEAEYVLELGVEVQASRGKHSEKQLANLVSAMYVGVEMAGSPMPMINKLGPTCIASDFGNNAGLIVGSKIPDWQSRSLDSLSATVTIDGALAGEASAGVIPGGPLRALGFLIEICSRRGLTLPPGTLVSTGATTGIHDVTVASKSRVDFGDLGFFDLAFEAMTPRH